MRSEGARNAACDSSPHPAAAASPPLLARPLPALQNADMVFERCFVPDSARLPGVDSFKDTNKVLAISRWAEGREGGAGHQRVRRKGWNEGCTVQPGRCAHQPGA